VFTQRGRAETEVHGGLCTLDRGEQGHHSGNYIHQIKVYKVKAMKSMSIAIIILSDNISSISIWPYYNKKQKILFLYLLSCIIEQLRSMYVVLCSM